MRYEALYSLGCVHADPGIAIPVLTAALRDVNGHVQSGALLALGLFGTNGQAAVPAILALFPKSSPEADEPPVFINHIVLSYATNALQRIDPAAHASLTNGNETAP